MIFYFLKFKLNYNSGLCKTPNPVLSQNGVNFIDFSTKFNNYTKSLYIDNIPLSVVVFIKSRGVFDFYVKKPSLNILFSYFLKDKNNTYKNMVDKDKLLLSLKKTNVIFIHISSFFDLVRIYSNMYNLDYWKSSKLIFSYIFSKNFDIYIYK